MQSTILDKANELLKDQASVILYDVGTILKKKDIPKYLNFLEEKLNCTSVQLKRSFVSNNNTIQVLKCYGNIGEISIARLLFRTNGWVLIWVQDAIDNGYVDKKDILYDEL